MYVAWGPELTCLYNDAYVAIIGGKHPEALGQPLRKVWADIWNRMAPLVEATLAGEATFQENAPVTVSRNGYEEQAYFTFSFSPIHDDCGSCAGLFTVVTETTG